MAKDWQLVKDEIEKEIDKIWWDEPEEVKKSKLGIFPSGAGTGGQVLGNLFFLVADTQGMGWWTGEPAVNQVIADPTFTLDHCKRVWKYITLHMAVLMGEEDPPGCPAPWLNLPKLWQFCKDIADSLDTVKTKEEFKDLVWSWFNYVNRLNKWFFLAFPWHFGKEYPRIESSHVKEMARLCGLKIVG